MFNILAIISVAVVMLISNYIAFGYGMRIGKAMQKEIPEAPLVEPVKKTGKKLLSLAIDLKKKSYIQKKAVKEEFSIFD